MKNLLLNSPAAWVGLLGASVLLTGFNPKPKPTADVPRSRTFVLTSTATVPVPPAGTKMLDLWLPVPHSDASQDVRDLKIESAVPYKIEKGAYGNQMLHLRPAAMPTTPLTVKLTATVTRREHLNLLATSSAATTKPKKEKADPDMVRWLAPDRLVPLDPKIKQQAEEVVAKANAKTNLEKARAIYEHVVSTVAYDKTGQGWGRGDIYYACDARRGNCTDFHAIVIGYCRSLGIPARFSIGLPLPAQRGKGEVKGYHCWAEFYTKETGWVPVDASEAAKDPSRRNYFFGAHDENRVEFTRGRDVTLTPKQAGSALNYFVYPYAEADGKPLEGVERSYLFEDQMATGKITLPTSPATGAVPPTPTTSGAAQRLVFVYNADSGVLNGMMDMVHKAVSPSTYSCDLCAITYDFTGMRKDWKQAVEALPLPSEFLHRNEFVKAYPSLRGQALPAIFSADAAGQLTTLISAAEMKPLTLESLISLVRTRTQTLVAVR